MRLHASFTITVRDRQGRQVARLTRPSRSYVNAFINGLWAESHNTTISTPNTTGSSFNLEGNTPFFDVNAADNIDIYGLVLGSGTNAVAIGDYALQTQIPHGLGAGQLDHEAHSWVAPTTVGTTRSWKARRIFWNNSGASITINECGIYFRSNVGGVYKYFCAVRDLVSPAVTVPNGGAASLEYTLGITV